MKVETKRLGQLNFGDIILSEGQRFFFSFARRVDNDQYHVHTVNCNDAKDSAEWFGGLDTTFTVEA